MPRFTVDTFRNGWHEGKYSLAREVGAGGTILEALRDFAEIGWQEEPDTLLKTVVWVWDERGRIVGVGYYWVPSFDNPYIQVDRWPILSVQFSGGGLWSFYRVPDGDSYKFRCSQVR